MARKGRARAPRGPGARPPEGDPRPAGSASFAPMERRGRGGGVLGLALACALATGGARADEVADAGDPRARLEAGAVFASYALGPPSTWHVVELLGHDVAPGDKQRLFLDASESFAGGSVELPVLVARGRESGPTLCLVAGVHGDELNGIEVVRRTFENLRPSQLRGMVIAVPVANLHGFRRSSRYLPDRRDLNRFFPGDPAGSSASRIANAIFQGVVRHCGALIDFHTGSHLRANLPQIRADLRRPGLLDLARALGIGVVVHSGGTQGTLRRAAVDSGVAAVTYEAGEPLRFQSHEIRRGIEGTWSLMASLGMVRSRPVANPMLSAVYYTSRWVRVDDGGIFLTDRKLGDPVKSEDLLGTVTDPVSNERSAIHAPVSGRIIGMAFPQVVIPGFAAFHIGIDSEPPAVSAGVPEPRPQMDGEGVDELEGEESPE